MKREDLQTASQCSPLPLIAQLAAGLVMVGFRIVPEDLWDAIATKLDKLDLDKGVDGFKVERNHVRGEQHEVWQALVLPKEYEFGTWVIPCDELLEMKGGSGYCDFVSITRLMFTGTEEDLRQRVEQLLVMPDCEC